MILKLSKEALGSLPAPDSQGLIRVTATIELTKDGANLVEVNDTPVGNDPEEDGENDDNSPMPEKDLPDLDKAMSDIYQP